MRQGSSIYNSAVRTTVRRTTIGHRSTMCDQAGPTYMQRVTMPSPRERIMLLRLQILLFLATLSLFCGCGVNRARPTETMFVGTSGGCGDFHVYRFDAAKTSALSVYVSEKAFSLTEIPTDLDVAADQKQVRVEILQFASVPVDYFCDDVGGDTPPVTTWSATSGKVICSVSPGAPPPEVRNATHRVTVVLKNVTFKNDKSGESIVLDGVEIPDVWVGWLPG